VKDNLYVNLTNRCPCNCTFCIRNEAPGVYGSDNLWLEREPEVSEVLTEFAKYPPDSYNEVVFCGYGEPMERAEDVAVIGKYVKENYNKTVRLNTNGLGSLIMGKPCEALLEGTVDIVSISLNAPNRESYNAVTRPKWNNAFDEMLKFAVNVKPFVKKVMFTIVDVLSAENTEACRQLAERIGVELRIRKLDYAYRLLSLLYFAYVLLCGYTI
jgi:radical SAM enzyme (TIGR04100 family)